MSHQVSALQLKVAFLSGTERTFCGTNGNIRAAVRRSVVRAEYFGHRVNDPAAYTFAGVPDDNARGA